MTAKCTCIDFFSSVSPLPATHNRWSDSWDVGQAIIERRRGGRFCWVEDRGREAFAFIQRESHLVKFAGDTILHTVSRGTAGEQAILHVKQIG